LMAQGHPTAKLRSDPRDRQQHFLQGRTPRGTELGGEWKNQLVDFGARH
jgi:hypothetical protein